MTAVKKKLLMKQKAMEQVVWALLPISLAAVYFYGWKFIAVLAVVNIVGFLCEYLFVRKAKQPVSTAVFVTSFIFALSLPPTIPLWIAAVGVAFGIVFGKMVFGGFGRNVFNPAISGRAFIYISFGVPLTSGFTPPVGGLAGGFAAWSTGVDALTKATPLVQMAGGTFVSPLTLFLGNHPGSFGETSALLIILCGLFILVKKAASYQIVISGLLGFLLLQGIVFLSGIQGAIDPLSGLLSGSILFGIFFMATDPVSASQTTAGGRWIYGALIGMLTSLIRTFSIWPEGFTFALLTANMFAPLLDHVMKSLKSSKKKRAAV